MITTWENIHPGDFVHLSCNEVIPADILLLRSSDSMGISHLETSNLDGENNLKQRQIVTGFEYEVNVQFKIIFYLLTISLLKASRDALKSRICA